MKERLVIALLGGFEAHWATGEPLNLPSRKGKGLLAYLAMSRGRAQPRDKLATLLWGNSSPDQARASLRQSLSQLRRSLGDENRAVLQGESDLIALEPSAAVTDAVRFERLVDAGTPETLEEASELYRGSFLEGFGLLTDPFEAWLMAERMRLHDLAEGALARLVEHYRRAHATEDAIRVALRLLRLDPSQESVHRLLMRLYAEQGRPRLALRQYEVCRDILQRELGEEPDRETRRLADEIRTEQPTAVVSGLDVPPRRAAEAGPGRAFDVAIEDSAERRFVTLMSCSLVDAAALSSRLDPEELRPVIVGFEDCCERQVSRHGGSNFHLGASVVTACFGYPRADEHDAERAVRAALDIVAEVGRLTLLPGIRMQSRIGIASGEVVVGKRVHGSGMPAETIAGDTPHIVTGLQAMAEPGSVLVADSTRKLLGALFEYEDLGSRALDGFDVPVRVWRVLGERGGQSRFEATRGVTALTPLVGREEEIALLERRWERAESGSGQVVVLTGEPGIGKSRLIEALRERLTGKAHLHVGYYCSPHHQESALYPVIQQLERAAGYAREDPPAVKLDKLEELLVQTTDDLPSAVPLIAHLLSIPMGDRYPPLNLTPQRQKEKTLEALEARLIALSAQMPVLMIFEDLHWSDPATREVLERLVERVRSLPVLVVVTHRPDYSIPGNGEPHVTTLVVKRLLPVESEALVAKLTGEKRLAKEVVAQIVDKADGVPLFIEELAKSVLEGGVLDGGGDRRALGVPSTLHDLLLARLDRLGPAKAVAQQAAVIGRGFSYALLAAVVTLGEPELRDTLARLTDSELVHARGAPPHAIYGFKHALVQDAAYASLLRAERGPLHARIAKALEERFPEVAEVEPEVLARHFAEAGLEERAIPYWQRAGELATRRWAYREAIAYFDRALASLKALPQTSERNMRELGLQVLLGQAWIIAAGYAAPQVGVAFDRARELCEAIGDANQLFFALLGSWQLYVAKQQLPLASATVERLLSLARELGNRDLAIEAHVAQLVTAFTLGAFEQTLAHSNEAIALGELKRDEAYILSAGYDGRVIALTGAAWALWVLGYPDQALLRAQEALAMARRLAHPYSEAMALYCYSWLHVFRREASAARELAEQGIALSIEHGFVWTQAFTGVLHGWALAEEGRAAEGAQEIREYLAALEQMGHMLWRPHQEGMLASALFRAGETAQALDVVTLALESARSSADVEHLAELLRQKGELMLQRTGMRAAAEAEKCFREAVEISRQQRAKSWELRASVSLAELWRNQGKREEARELLAPLYGWFTEGFDAPDLRDAKALLDTLA